MAANFQQCRVLIPAVVLSMVLSGCMGDNPEKMLASAKEYIAKNDNKAAIIQIKNILQKNPENGEARFLLGKALLETGDAVAAEVELRKAKSLGFQPDQTTAALASALVPQGKYKKLIEEFGTQQLNSADSEAELRTAVALSYLSEGNVPEAEKGLRAALSAKGDYVPALIAQTRAKASQGDYSAASTILDTVLAKAPSNSSAWKLKGDLLLGQRQTEQAVPAFQKAIELKPDYLPAHASLISLFNLLNRGDDAVKQTELLKKVAPKHPMTVYLDAQQAYRRGELPRASELVQQVLKVQPDNLAALQLAGSIEYQRKSYPQAEQLFGKLVHLAPDSLDAKRLLASTYLRLGQSSKAMGVLEPILGKIQQDASMLALVGEAFVQSGNMAKAEEYFAKASRVDPKSTPVKTALALTHLANGNDSAFVELEKIAAADSGSQADMALISASMRRGQFDKALAALDVLQKKQPENPLVQHLRGGALLGKKDIAGARKSFDAALALKPGYFPSAAALASLDMADKKPDAAAKRFESVLAVDPKSTQALLTLASLKELAGGSADEVGAMIGKAISANPTDAESRLALMAFHAKRKDYKKAIVAGQEALAAIPDHPQLLAAFGQMQFGAGESNQALSTFGKLATLQPGSPVPHLSIAEVHLAGKNRDAAMQSLRKALEIKPDFVDAQRTLINLYLDAGQRDKALALSRDMQKQKPKEAAGYLFEGDVRAASKSWAEATAAYRAGLAAAPNTELAIRLHSALKSAGNNAEADKSAAAWMKAHPKDFGFRLYIGDRLIAAGDLDGAAAQYRSVIEVQSDNVLALNNLAWISARQKSPKALEYAESANRARPNTPAVMDTLAMILLEKGETPRAVELLKGAVERAPDAHVIRFNLAKALIKGGDKAGAKKELDWLAKLGDKFPFQADVAKMTKEL